VASNNIDDKAVNSLKFVDSFFNEARIKFWIEAGTALAAWRDGKLLDWDHDIDIAIWYDDCPSHSDWTTFFLDTPYRVIFQKDLPYLDNIIQLRLKEPSMEHVMDIDIYLYKRHSGFAYMRWLHKPVGFLAPTKRVIFNYLSQLLKPRTAKWKMLARLIPRFIRWGLFWGYIYFYLRMTESIFHRFDEDLFLNLKTIKLYGMDVRIAADTDRYLAHRYGKNWMKPDPNYNQKGTWKQSGARPRLPLDTLPPPKKIEMFDFNVYD